MWRHAVFEGLEVKRKPGGIEPSLFHASDEHVVIVNALRPAIYFESAEEQVETSRERRFARVLIGIKGALLRRIPSDKDEIRLFLLFRPSANSPLLLRLEIVFLRSAECIQRLLQCEHRDLIRDERKAGIESRKHITMYL